MYCLKNFFQTFIVLLVARIPSGEITSKVNQVSKVDYANTKVNCSKSEPDLESLTNVGR